MKLVVDASDYQRGLALDAVAASVDGAWFKAGDWAWASAHGWPADDIHAAALARFAQLDKPRGSYFFPRPGWTDPRTQVDAWRAHCPAGLTMSPMVDLEVPGTLSGGSLRDWTDEALHWTTDRFEWTPTLYSSSSFFRANGMTAPATPHIPMAAEYHYGYRTFPWADRANWPATAYRAFGGPDVPPGYSLRPTDLVWQFTSSGEIPGMPGLVDCSLVPDAAWSALVATGQSPSTTGFLMSLTEQEQATMRDQLAELRAAVLGLTSNNAPRLYELEARLNVVYAILTDSGRFPLLEARAGALERSAIDIAAGVAKINVGGVDVDALAAKLVATVLRGFDTSKEAAASFQPPPDSEPLELEVAKMAKVAPGYDVTDEQLDHAAVRLGRRTP